MTNPQHALLWFRRDLRVQDQALLQTAFQSGLKVCALVFEPPHRSPKQLQFFWQSIEDLRKSLQAFGIPLTVLQGAPETEVPRWARRGQCQQVLATAETNHRDQMTERAVAKALGEIPLKLLDQRTLCKESDLPFPVAELPNVFTVFRKQLEQDLKISEPLPRLHPQDIGFEIQSPSESVILNRSSPEFRENLGFQIRGGETAAWERLHEYFGLSGFLSQYKETRNGMLKKNDSSKFSPWLALGCLSARSIYHEIKKYEALHGPNESTAWFVQEMLWRDYFKFLALKFGDRFFSRTGLFVKQKEWSKNTELFEKWTLGQTGADFVDAHMIELRETGWMSNRGRQNVASFLSKTLNLDWTWGAHWFEKYLIDEDPESNWGNWLYVAGMGTDPRDRVFNIERQAQMYDPQGDYRKRWLP